MRMAEFEKNTEMTAELLRDTDGLNKLMSGILKAP
jgi:hypothetical protein